MNYLIILPIFAAFLLGAGVSYQKFENTQKLCQFILGYPPAAALFRQNPSKVYFSHTIHLRVTLCEVLSGNIPPLLRNPFLLFIVFFCHTVYIFLYSLS